MIEYAVLLAKKQNIKEASLFIGEIHNSDIQWYVQQYQKNPANYDTTFNQNIADIIHTAHYYFDNPIAKARKKFFYLALSALTIFPCFALYFMIFEMLKHFIK